MHVLYLKQHQKEFLKGRTEKKLKEVSGVFAPRCLKKSGNTVILIIDARNENDWSKIQTLPYVGYEFVIGPLEMILATEDDGEFCNCIDVDLENIISVDINTFFFFISRL